MGGEYFNYPENSNSKRNQIRLFFFLELGAFENLSENRIFYCRIDRNQIVECQLETIRNFDVQNT